MPSAFGHALFGSALGASFRARGAVIAAAAFCAVAPDLDVVAFRFGVPYEAALGHRGATHSFAFAAVLGVAAAAVLCAALRRDARPQLARTAALLALATSSHGLFDALTDGGLGVAFLWPLDDARFFLPWRPIAVSPLGVGRFFSARGAEVLASKGIWLGQLAVMVAQLFGEGDLMIATRLRVLLLSLVGAACGTPGPLTVAHLPEHFEPVARLEDSLDLSNITCKRPFALVQDCYTGWLSDLPQPKQTLHLAGVSMQAAGSADGRIVLFMAGGGRPQTGVTPTDVNNYAYVQIEKVLAAERVAIERPRALRFVSPYLVGYLLELDGDGYSILKRISAAAPVPPPPAQPASSVASNEERPSQNPWGYGDGALLVTAPPIVIDEARGFDAIYQVSCDSVFLFLQECSNWRGPLLKVSIGSVSARVAATREGDVLLISGPADFAGDFKRLFDPKITDPVNLSTRAVLIALRARGFEARRVRAAVYARRGPVYAYIVELDRDAFTYLRTRAVSPEPKPAPH